MWHTHTKGVMTQVFVDFKRKRLFFIFMTCTFVLFHPLSWYKGSEVRRASTRVVCYNKVGVSKSLAWVWDSHCGVYEYLSIPVISKHYFATRLVQLPIVSLRDFDRSSTDGTKGAILWAQTERPKTEDHRLECPKKMWKGDPRCPKNTQILCAEDIRRRKGVGVFLLGGETRSFSVSRRCPLTEGVSSLSTSPDVSLHTSWPSTRSDRRRDLPLSLSTNCSSRWRWQNSSGRVTKYTRKSTTTLSSFSKIPCQTQHSPRLWSTRFFRKRFPTSTNPRPFP
jgi:hypothetical protein